MREAQCEVSFRATEKMRLGGDITSDHFGGFKKPFDVRADEHVRVRFRFPMPMYYRWLIVEKVRNWYFVCRAVFDMRDISPSGSGGRVGSCVCSRSYRSGILSPRH
jgi:hypothetical protein